MAWFDLPPAQLAKYNPAEKAPRDFAAFWKQTLAESAQFPVDPHFVQRQIELRFDPFDLSILEVWMDGNCFGVANVVQQGREKHIAVERLSTHTPAPAQPKSSLDYLTLLRAEYQQHQRQQAGSLRFSQIPLETK